MKYANEPAAATLVVRPNADANCIIEFGKARDFEKQPPLALRGELLFGPIRSHTVSSTSYNSTGSSGINQ